MRRGGSMEICLMTSNVLGNWNDGFIENRDDCMAEIYLEYSPDVIIPALKMIRLFLQRIGVLFYLV